jgi:hypothetical protein
MIYRMFHKYLYKAIHVFFTSALVGGEWSASRPSRFIPGERASGTHWIGGWVGSRAGLDDMEKLIPYRESNSDFSVVEPVASHNTDCDTAAVFSLYSPSTNNIVKYE